MGWDCIGIVETLYWDYVNYKRDNTLLDDDDDDDKHHCRLNLTAHNVWKGTPGERLKAILTNQRAHSSQDTCYRVTPKSKLNTTGTI